MERQNHDTNYSPSSNHSSNSYFEPPTTSPTSWPPPNLSPNMTTPSWDSQTQSPRFSGQPQNINQPQNFVGQHAQTFDQPMPYLASQQRSSPTTSQMQMTQSHVYSQEQFYYSDHSIVPISTMAYQGGSSQECSHFTQIQGSPIQSFPPIESISLNLPEKTMIHPQCIPSAFWPQISPRRDQPPPYQHPGQTQYWSDTQVTPPPPYGQASHQAYPPISPQPQPYPFKPSCSYPPSPALVPVQGHNFHAEPMMHSSTGRRATMPNMPHLTTPTLSPIPSSSPPILESTPPKKKSYRKKNKDPSKPPGKPGRPLKKDQLNLQNRDDRERLRKRNYAKRYRDEQITKMKNTSDQLRMAEAKLAKMEKFLQNLPMYLCNCCYPVYENLRKKFEDDDDNNGPFGGGYIGQAQMYDQLSPVSI